MNISGCLNTVVIDIQHSALTVQLQIDYIKMMERQMIDYLLRVKPYRERANISLIFVLPQDKGYTVKKWKYICTSQNSDVELMSVIFNMYTILFEWDSEEISRE